MAKLPPLINQQSIGTSDLPFSAPRLQTANTETWRAVSRVGDHLDHAAGEQRRLEAHLEAKRQATAKADKNLQIESTLMDYGLSVHQKALEDADNMPEGGMGYAKGISDYAGMEADRIITEKFGDYEDKEALAVRFQRVRQSVVEGALNTEMTERLKWRGDVSEKKISGLTGAIGVDPANYDAAVAEWESYVQSSITGGENIKARFKQHGLTKLARAEIESVAATRPVEFRAAFRGAFENQPTQAAEPHVAGIVDAANDAGLNPTLLLSVAKIESQVNPKAGSPTKADGTKMSSAIGMWQILDQSDTLNELGISKEDRTNYTVATPAIAAYFARQQNAMLRRGEQPTPGKLYMTWNLGPGAAAAVMRADPNEKIENVLTRVWASKGPAFINQALSNNPSMYRRGMTVGQVRSNYEAKMSAAEKATAGFVTGKNLTTDEQARAVFTSLGINGAQFLTASDAAEVFVKTNDSIGKQTKAQLDQARGIALLNGEINGSPYDADNQTVVNNVVAENGLSVGVASGDPAAVQGVAMRTKNAGFIPLPDVNAFREAMNVPGDSPAKLTAYAALTDIATRSPVAFDASKLPEDERARVNEYRAFTENLLLSPAEAVKRIDAIRTPEGKKEREATHDMIRDETKELGWETISAHFDNSWWSTPDVTKESQRGLAEMSLRSTYTNYRLSGKSAEEAQALALSDMGKKMWGVSTVGGSQVFMPFPPEKFFSSEKTGGSFDWIEKQARNTALSHMTELGILKDKVRSQSLGASGIVQGKVKVGVAEQFENIEVRLIPRAETSADYRANKPLRYELWYRRPDGTTDVIPGRWFTPDQAAAEREYDDEFKKRVKPIKDKTGGINMSKAFVR